MTLRYVLLSALLTSALAGQGQLLTPEQLQADLSRFRTALQQAHPAMYRYTPRARFDSLFAAVAKGLNRPLTQREFYVALTPLLVALRDGHIKWLRPETDEHYPFSTDSLFPLKLYFADRRAWISGHYAADPVPRGAEVIAINDQPVGNLIDALLPTMTFADGMTVTGKYADLNQFFPGYYATYIGRPGVHELTYRLGNSTGKLHLPAVPLATINNYVKQHTPLPQPTHRISFDDSSQTATLTIERFWTKAGELSFRRFLAQTFLQIKARHVQNLVLDLRGNEGGNETHGLWLYRYLARGPFRYYDRISVQQRKAYSFPAWTPKLYRMLRWLVVRKQGQGYVLRGHPELRRQKPQRDAFRGKLYVLIDGSSFSVTTEVAARIHADQRATFIGQETGGAYEGNNSGIFAITQLPQSKIDLGVPLFGFYMADLPGGLQKGQGIRPDHLVIPTIEDVLKGCDPVLHYVRQLTRSQP